MPSPISLQHTLIRLYPCRRLRLRSLRPLDVRMRARNPIFLARFTLLTRLG
jgi:hypothetical protein